MGTTTMILAAFLSWGALLAAGAPTADSNLRFVVTGHRLPRHGFVGAPAVYDAGRDAIYVLGGGETVQYSFGTGVVQLIGRFKSSSGGVAAMDGDDMLHFGGYYFGPEPLARDGCLGFRGRLPEAVSYSAVAWDASSRVAYVFGGHMYFPFSDPETVPVDSVFRYNATSRTAEDAGRLPRATERAGAVWDSVRGAAYVFGGKGVDAAGFRDILRFDPLSSNFSTLPVQLPEGGLFSPCTVFDENSGQVYLIDRQDSNPAASAPVVRVYPSLDGRVEKLPVAGWPPGGLRSFSCAYVSGLRRVYILGGSGGGWGTDSLEIGYIDLPGAGNGK